MVTGDLMVLRGSEAHILTGVKREFVRFDVSCEWKGELLRLFIEDHKKIY